MHRPAFDALDRDWAELVRSPAAREALEHWSTEPALSAEDLDVFAYDGERIDIEPLFREQFVRFVPYAPLCAEDCKGLCSQCGIDLNSGTCSCEKPIDPRLAALKGLKLPS